ncbi:MAG: ABC transporter substrate-binding protein [Bacilli bacterium]
MKNKIKKIFLLGGLLLNTIPLESCKDSNLIKLTVAEVTHSIFYAPQYIAKSLGYFEEEGIDINIITTSGADKTMAALLSKEAQIGLMGPEASVYVYQNGQEDYAINFAQLTQKDGSFLLARDPIENFTFDMLKGKTIIGGRKGGMPEMTLEYVLKKHGLNIGQNDPSKEVNIRTDVAFDVMAGVFTAGQSDFVTLFEPSASQVVRNGIGHIVTSIGEASGEVPYTCYSTLKSYREKNKDIIIKFSNAIERALTFVHTHTIEEIIPHLKDHFVSSDEIEIKNVMNNYLNIEAWPTNISFNESSFNRLIEIIKEAGELPKDTNVPYNKLVQNI